MSSTVALLCFGRKGYAFAAANLVASLRHYGFAGKIVIYLSDNLRPVMPQWCLDEVELVSVSSNDPAWVKLSLPEMIEGPTLYLDCDMVALQDITPWIEELEKDERGFIAQVQGKGRHGQPIKYFEWASTETCVKKHELPEDATFYGLQSSWMFLRPSELLSSIASTAKTLYSQWTTRELKHTWGGSKPDELFWSLACTMLWHDPSFKIDPIFFGTGFDRLPTLKEKYYVLTIYGRKGQVPSRFVQCYDAVMRTVHEAKGRYHELKAGTILADKHCNFKKPHHALQLHEA